MIDLGQTEFRLAIPGVDAVKLESLSNTLFDEWEQYVAQALTISDYSLFLQIEEGSINGWGKIRARAYYLASAITVYGGFFSGLDVIVKQLSASREFLAEHALSTFACPPTKAITRKNGGSPVYLKRLFARVQAGELTADEATFLAHKHLEGVPDETLGLLDSLAEAFKQCPRLPVQVPLPLMELDEIPPLQIAPRKSNSEPKPKKPEFPPILKYRIEVWRESKRKKKISKISPI